MLFEKYKVSRENYFIFDIIIYNMKYEYDIIWDICI